MSVEAKKITGLKLSPLPIDYKKLTPNDFPWAKWDDKPYNIVPPDEKGYVSDP